MVETMLKMDLGFGLDSALFAFADGLASTWKEKLKEDKKEINRIFELLRKNFKDLDRFVIAGSMGKTVEPGLPKTDYDLVVFVTSSVERGGFSPFKKMLGEFADFCEKRSDFRILTGDGETFIGVEINGLLQLDIFPALNMKGRLLHLRGQEEGTLKLISNLATPITSTLYYNKGLAESAVRLIKNKCSHNKLFHNLLQLAKFWNSHTHFPQECLPFLSGRSYLMAVIALHVVQIMEAQGRDESLLDALEEFLCLMENFQTIRIIIEPEDGKKKKEDPILKIPGIFKDWNSAIGGPLILDPINPYCNLAGFSNCSSSNLNSNSNVNSDSDLNSDLNLDPESKNPTILQSIIVTFEERGSLCLRKLRKLKKKRKAHISIASKADVIHILDDSPVKKSKRKQFLLDNKIDQGISNMQRRVIKLVVVSILFVIFAILAITLIEIK